MIKIRFRDFPMDISREWMIELVSLASAQPVLVVEKPSEMVDLEFTGPYGGKSDDYTTPFITKLKRMGYIKVTKGHHLSKPKLSAGIQPSKKAKINIWFKNKY